MPTPRIQPVDWRQILTGSEAEMYTSNRVFMASVNRWNLQAHIENTRYHPAGVKRRVGVHVAHDLTLSLTETVVRKGDPLLLKPFALALAADGDYQPDWAKSVILRLRADSLAGDGGTDQWIVVNDCVPDGTIDIENIQPGTVLERPWNFIVNDMLAFQSWLE